MEKEETTSQLGYWKYVLGAGLVFCAVAGGIYYYKNSRERSGSHSKRLVLLKVDTSIYADITLIQAQELLDQPMEDYKNIIERKTRENDRASLVNLHYSCAKALQKELEKPDLSPETQISLAKAVMEQIRSAYKNIVDLNSTMEGDIARTACKAFYDIVDRVIPPQEDFDILFDSERMALQFIFDNIESGQDIPKDQRITSVAPMILADFIRFGGSCKIGYQALPDLEDWLDVCLANRSRAPNSIINSLRLYISLAKIETNPEEASKLLDEIEPNLDSFKSIELTVYHHLREVIYTNTGQREKAMKHQEYVINNTDNYIDYFECFKRGIENFYDHGQKEKAREIYDKTYNHLKEVVDKLKALQSLHSKRTMVIAILLPTLRILTTTVRLFRDHTELLDAFGEVLPIIEETIGSSEDLIETYYEFYIAYRNASVGLGEIEKTKQFMINFVTNYDHATLLRFCDLISDDLIWLREEVLAIETLEKIIVAADKKHSPDLTFSSLRATFKWKLGVQLLLFTGNIKKAKRAFQSVVSELQQYFGPCDAVIYFLEVESKYIDILSGNAYNNNYTNYTDNDNNNNTTKNIHNIKNKRITMDQLEEVSECTKSMDRDRNPLVLSRHAEHQKTLGNVHKAIQALEELQQDDTALKFIVCGQGITGDIWMLCELYAIAGQYSKITPIIERLNNISFEYRYYIMYDSPCAEKLNGFGYDVVVVALYRDYGPDQISERVEELAMNLAQRANVKCKGRGPLNVWNQWLNLAEILMIRGKPEQSGEWLYKVQNLMKENETTSKRGEERDRNLQLKAKIRGARIWNEMKVKEEARSWMKGIREEVKEVGSAKDEVEVIALEAAIEGKKKEGDLEQIEDVLRKDEDKDENGGGKRWRGMCWRDVAESFVGGEGEQEQRKKYLDKAKIEFEGLGTGWNTRMGF